MGLETWAPGRGRAAATATAADRDRHDGRKQEDERETHEGLIQASRINLSFR